MNSMNETWKKKLWVCLLVLSIIILTGCGQTGQSTAVPAIQDGVIVKVLDVGQGDSILIKTTEQVVLIDSGDSASSQKLLGMLAAEKVRKIDKVIITHPHSDHLGGLPAVMGKYNIVHIYDSGQTNTSKLYRNYLKTVKNKKIPFSIVQAGQAIEIGGSALLQVLSPSKPYFTGTRSDLNNNSIVLKLVFKDFSMLLAADAEKPAEQRLLKQYGEKLQSNILKVGHHGSSTASSPGFIKKVSPAEAIISLGANNEYHHPHPSVLKKYNKEKIKIYRTDLHGTITIRSDGRTYSIAKEKG